MSDTFVVQTVGVFHRKPRDRCSLWTLSAWDHLEKKGAMEMVSYCSNIAIVLCSYHARMMTMMMFEEEQMRSSDIPRDGPIIRRIK